MCGGVFVSAEKVLSSLCYFSLFFAPFVLPILVYIFCIGNEDIKHHAKSACVSHILPFVCAIFLLVIGLSAGHFALAGLAPILFIVAMIGSVIWNIARGIRVLFV